MREQAKRKSCRTLVLSFVINPIGASGTSAGSLDPRQAHPHTQSMVGAKKEVKNQKFKSDWITTSTGLR